MNTKRTVSSEIKRLIALIDPKSWPAFIMFAVVLIAAGWLNYVAMSPIIGGFGAVMIALFFGFGVLSWHIVESRTDDSEFQESVAGIVKWLNAGLDGSLIVLNLFRAELHSEAIAGMNWADTVAFLIIGVSAASHVVGYLLWTKNDPRRILKKEGERDLYEVSQKRQRSDNAIQSTRARADALKFVIDEEKKIREEYEGIVPQWQVDELIRQMKINALKDFEGLQVEPQDIQQTQAAPTGNARNLRSLVASNKVYKRYTLDDLLGALGLDRHEAVELITKYNLNTAGAAMDWLRGRSVYPRDLAPDNFAELYNELMSTALRIPAKNNGITAGP